METYFILEALHLDGDGALPTIFIMVVVVLIGRALCPYYEKVSNSLAGLWDSGDIINFTLKTNLLVLIAVPVLLWYCTKGVLNAFFNI